MSKLKKILADARDAQNREIDLVDQNISAIEECPGLSEYRGNHVKSILGVWAGNYDHLDMRHLVN